MTREKHHRPFLFSAAAVAGGLALICFLWLRNSEPLHLGKPLSYWLQGYTAGSSSKIGLTPADANAALDEAGTNATPTLLRMLRAKDSSLEKNVIALLRKQRLVSIPYDSSLQQNLQAVSGFLYSAKARDAVSINTWIKVYERRPSMVVTHFVVGVLGDLGPAAKDAAPVLLRVAGDTNSQPILRVDAFDTLGKIHAPPQQTVPVLLRATHDASPLVRDSAIENLGLFGGDAKIAVGVLLDFVQGSNSSLGDLAFHALWQIDPAAAARALRDAKVKP